MKQLPTVDIAIPVYYGNLEEIEGSVKKQVAYYTKNLKTYNWKIIIAINGKNPEKQIALVKQLNKKYKGKVNYTYINKPGKGHGVIHAWENSKADIMSYMDVDLATDLGSFKTLLDNIQQGNDIAVGSRYLKTSKIKRTFKRIFISKTYITYFYRFILGLPLTDAQCGFKAVNKKVVKNVLPYIQDRVWFWESEMLYLAYKRNYKIKEVSIRWTEDLNSSVNLVKIIPNFMKNVLRLRFSRLPWKR
tara:strand:- start:3532 stop:4269 length:738 start_codon:yes stop_codon:yes gene_type:complete